MSPKMQSRGDKGHDRCSSLHSHVAEYSYLVVKSNLCADFKGSINDFKLHL
jgi:hypothetical protein